MRCLPLMTYCAMRGCLEAVKACLAAGAQVDLASCYEFDGWHTAVVHATRWGHEAVVEALLEAGASAKVGRRHGQDHTLVAVCGGHPTPGIVKRLVEAGADVHSRVFVRTAFTCAAGRGNLAVMEVLVELGADVATADELGRNAMHWAATGEVVRWLLAHGASVQGDGGYQSPLCEACEEGRVDTVRALIELGADVNYKDRDGQTALHHAASFSKEQEAVEMTGLLVAAGADVNAVNESGTAPLHFAQHAACVDLLVDAGADLEVRDGEGCMPIYPAATGEDNDRPEVVLRLADRGANLVNTGGEPGLVKRRVEELRAERSRGQAI